MNAVAKLQRSGKLNKLTHIINPAHLPHLADGHGSHEANDVSRRSSTVNLARLLRKNYSQAFVGVEGQFQSLCVGVTPHFLLSATNAFLHDTGNREKMMTRTQGIN